MNIDYTMVATFTGHIEAVNSVAIAPKSTNFIVSGSSDKMLKSWELNNVFKAIKIKSNFKSKAEEIEEEE